VAHWLLRLSYNTTVVSFETPIWPHGAREFLGLDDEERAVQVIHRIVVGLQERAAREPEGTRQVSPLINVGGRAIDDPNGGILAVFPDQLALREELGASVACGHVLLRRLRVRRVLIRAGLDKLPSRVFRKVHAGVDGCRMSHGFLDELLVILRVEMGAIRGRALDPSHVGSPH